MPKEEDARELLARFVNGEGLKKHMLAVEAALRAYARKFGEDENIWGITGLLHDFDYEKFPEPDKHAREGARILAEMNYPPEIVEAILGHSPQAGGSRNSLLAKCLYACDELCGMVMAVAYVKPDKLKGVTVESVEKALKKKGFAARINREEIEKGISELSVPREEHILRVIKAMQEIEKELGF